MTGKLTNPVFISWYLAVVFMLGLLATSAVTVAPGHETFAAVLMAVCLGCAVVFTAMAIGLRRRVGSGLGLGGLGIGYAVFALVITAALVVSVVG